MVGANKIFTAMGAAFRGMCKVRVARGIRLLAAAFRCRRQRCCIATKLRSNATAGIANQQ